MKQLKELDFSKKKYIIFDMDGTLIDSIGIWNISDYEIIKELSNQEINLSTIQIDRDLFMNLNQNSNNIYHKYNRYLIDKYKLNVTEEEVVKLRRNITNKFLINDINFKPHVVKLIKKLKQLGFTLILATMTTSRQIDIYTYKNKNMYEQLNIKEYFDLIITQDQVKNKKPHPEIYLKILDYYQVDANECLVFEDSIHGVIASKEAGIETINIYDSYSDKDRDKINKLTDYKINSYLEVLESLETYTPVNN